MIVFLSAQLKVLGSIDSTFTFLEIGRGARPVGMGEAFVAMSDDVNSIYWNPAGLSKIRFSELTVSYLKYIIDINSGHLAYTMPVRIGVLGIGIIYLDYGKFDLTTEENPLGVGITYTAYDIASIISYGFCISNKLAFGLSMKGIYEKIYNYDANAVAIDFGVLYKTPINNLNLGFVVKNLGVQTKAFIDEKYNLPLAFTLGFAWYGFSEKLRLSVDLTRFYEPISDKIIDISAGIEYLWKNLISFRFGYQTKGDELKTGSSKDCITGFSVGLGFKIKRLIIDYAFLPFNELGDTHRLSLSIKFKT